ncbi:MAG: hypothetical protein GY799_04300 [Desulfobulbaceae bacterium]|nr:hypothetical protein [Desulfobulbaceae bacterium]
MIPYIERLEKVHDQIVNNPKSVTAATGGHCYRCRALPGCYSAAQAASRSLDVTYAPEFYPSEPEEMERQYELLLKAKKAIGLKTDAMKVYITEELKRSNQVLPGYELRPHVGRNCWKDPGAAVEFAAVYGVDLTATPKPVSIAEALKRGVDPRIINKLTHKPLKGMKLVKSVDYAEIFKGDEANG